MKNMLRRDFLKFSVFSISLLISCTWLWLYAANKSAIPWENDAFDWNKSKELYGGALKYAFVETKKPRPMKINVAMLESEKVDTVSTPRDKDWGKFMPDFKNGIVNTFRAPTRAFMEYVKKSTRSGGLGLPAIAAVNTSPCTPWEAPLLHTNTPNSAASLSPMGKRFQKI